VDAPKSKLGADACQCYRLLDSEVNHIIQRPVLSNSNQYRLVVRRGVDARKPVRAGGETRRDVRSEHAALRRGVQALEERELGRVRRGRLVERRQLLDDDMAVPLYLPLRVRELRRGKVVLLRVHEEARVQVVDRHLDRERRVRLDGAQVLRELELGARHVRRRRDHTHRRGVARAGLDLLAIGDREVGHGRAEVDKVVRGRLGRDLARLGLRLPVVLEACRDDGLQKRQ